MYLLGSPNALLIIILQLRGPLLVNLNDPLGRLQRVVNLLPLGILLVALNELVDRLHYYFVQSVVDPLQSHHYDDAGAVTEVELVLGR